jgi:hypothetical protein
MGKVLRGIVQNGLHAFFDFFHIHAPADGFVQLVDEVNELLMLSIDLRDVNA